MSKRVIMGVKVTNRLNDVPAVQKVLSDHGCNIKTRLGLHDVDNKTCSTQGLLILELFGKDADLEFMEKKLKKIKGIVVKKMVF
jgi:hypothetical protein